ncbi:MAG TPA: glycosyltransferase family 39 protein [Xanthobacteraceae bacterium]|nr:glycosyltransferase family 39 protein [Xanthobacteraceae bacterium]
MTDSRRVDSPTSAAKPCDGLAVAILALVAVVALLTFRDYGLGWDDYTHAEYGALLLELYGSGFADTQALTFVNLYAYGGGFDMVAALAAKILPFDIWETRRLCGALVGIAGLAVTWRIGRRIGGPIAGLIALTLLATCPLYYGHMFFNAKDAPFAVAMAIALLGLVRVFQEYPRPDAPAVALIGIGFGLAFGTRILGGLAGIYALAAFIILVVTEAPAHSRNAAMKRGMHFLVTLIPAGVLAYATMALVWPWGVVAPLNPFRALEYFSHFFEKPWRELFAGELIQVPDMPRNYVPQLFALRLPEILLALGIAGLFSAVVAVLLRRRSPQDCAALLVVMLAAVTPVVITVIERPAMYNGVRHFLFVVPPFAALAGYAGAQIMDWIGRHFRFGIPIAAIIFIIGVLLPVIEMVRLHPYQYTFFNQIIGGMRGANGLYMRDYWGLSFKQMSKKLLGELSARGEKQPEGRRWRIAVCGPHRPAQVELGPQFEIVWDPKGADFAMTLGEFYCRRLDAPIIAEVTREDIVYARVYDIRGRNFPTLLTIPAPE